MNCPKCRRALWYISGLSKPPDLKTYVCQSCNILLGFVPLTFKQGQSLYGGYRVVEGILRKTGYTAPPVMKRTPGKEPPSPASELAAHGSRQGEGE